MTSPVTVDTFTVFSDHYQPINPLNGSAVVKVIGGSTVYYADKPYVTSSTNQGSIALNASQTFTRPAWLISASLSSISVTTTVTSDDATLDAAAVATAEAASVLRDGTGMPVSVVSAATLAGSYTGGGYYPTDSSANTALGSNLPNLSPGLGGSNAHGNTIIGAEWTGTQLTIGFHNVAIGSGAFGAGNHTQGGGSGTLLTANNIIAIGDGALNLLTTGSANSVIGSSAGGAITTGQQNTGLGFGVLGGVTTTSDNTAVGNQALASSTGTDNTAVGSGALAGASNTVSNNTAVGRSALGSVSTGGLNAALGWHALTGDTTGANNTAVGYNAMWTNSTGSNSVAVGTSALALSTNGQNTAVGSSAGSNVSTGIVNTFVGQNTGLIVATGNGNTHIGATAGNGGANVDTNYTTLVGYGTVGGAQYAAAFGRNASATGSGAVAIGTDSTGAGAAAANADTIALGTAKHAVLLAGVATASAPTYRKGGMYFDTTLNKLRIGGATAWETVTSS